MEVHHHPHVGKKNFKEYFLEFLMIFLAVMLGFLAENQREHYVEHSRVKEFSKSLIRDLQNDTIAINAQVKLAGIYISITDSMLNLSRSKLEGITAARFSFFCRFIYWTQSLNWNRATFEQIKNSGGLRYFKNYTLLEKLMRYDALVNRDEAESDNHRIRGNLLLKQINLLLDPVYHQALSRYLLPSLDTMSAQTKENLFPEHPESLEGKRGDVRELLNMAVVQQRNLRLNIKTQWKQANELAAELITDLKNEYDLEE